MSIICGVPGCNESSGGFQLPNRKTVLAQWIGALMLGPDSYIPSSESIVCLKHFNENDYSVRIKKGLRTYVLNRNAVPSIFPWNSEVNTASEVIIGNYLDEGFFENTEEKAHFKNESISHDLSDGLLNENITKFEEIKCEEIVQEESKNVIEHESPVLNKPKAVSEVTYDLKSKVSNEESKLVSQIKEKAGSDNLLSEEQVDFTNVMTEKAADHKPADIKFENSTDKAFIQKKPDEVINNKSLINKREKLNKKIFKCRKLDSIENDHCYAAVSSCPCCNFKCNDKVKLQIHIVQTHFSYYKAHEKIYTCEACSYVTTSPEQLKDHVLFHVYVYKMHKCPKCSYVTKTRSQLKNHLKHNHFTLTCAYCSKVQITRGEHILHLEKHRSSELKNNIKLNFMKLKIKTSAIT